MRSVCMSFALNTHTMRQAVINIRVEQETKDAFSEVCDEVGLATFQAVNVFAKAVIRHGGIPFELKSRLWKNKAMEEIDKGGGHVVKDPQELFDELGV